MNSLIHSLQKSINNFFSWKKMIPVILIAQLTYIPCDINSQAKDKKKNSKEKVEEPIPDFLENDPPAKKGTMKWRSFHKAIYEKEGWGGPPEAIADGDDPFDESKKDFFYKRITARASARSIEMNSPALMMSSCQDSAKLNGVEESYRGFINAFLRDNPPDENRGQVIYNNMARATHYSCKYGQDESRNIVAKECKGFIKDHGLAVCWPKGEAKSWATCECLTYIKVDGGQNKLRTMVSYE